MIARKQVSASIIFILFMGCLLTGLRAQGVALGAEPLWRDTLDGKADSGAASFSGPTSTGQPALKGVSWVNEGIGQAAGLGSMDSYIGYAGSRLTPDQGTILLMFKPIRDLTGAFATRSPLWTDYGQAKPPQNGFLLDTIGWNGAPKGAFALALDPASAGNLSFLVWDGSKWHSLIWKTPDGWQWDAARWYEIGVTWGPGGMGIFLDGEMKAKLADVVSVSNSIPWFLGQAPWSWPYGPHTIMGVYDEVRVYGEQLAPYQLVSTGGASASQPAPSAASGGAAGAPASNPPATASVPPQASGLAPTVAPDAASSGASQPGASPKPAGAAPGAAQPAAGTQQNPDQSQSATKPAPIAGNQAGAASHPPQAPGSGGQTASGPGSGGTASGATGIAGELGKLTNVENLLPGGPSGDAAKTVRQLPGGSAVLWAVPVLLVLLGVILGRMGRRRDSAAQVRGPVATGGPASGVQASEARPRFCDMCGGALPPGAGFCGKCGAGVEHS